MNRLSSFNFIDKIKNKGWVVTFFLLIYLLVAYKSSGYHQEDEHYQIIEFANYKLGSLPQNRLAWEYNEQIRPGLQPFICYILFKLFNGLGIYDGYYLAFLLRAFTAVVSILVIKKFVDSYKSSIAPGLHPYFVLFSYLLWFIPYINVRFSSETWSGLFFLITLTFLRNKRYDNGFLKFILLGVLLGMSILFRYQSALLAVGIGTWFILVEKQGFRNIASMTASAIVILLLGVLIDGWLYGEFTISIYNYFNINLLKGVSSEFGISPWYTYLEYIILDTGPIGILIAISFFAILFVQPKSLVLWAIIPFLLVHCIIPHKEARFLYPIANLSPLIMVLGYQIIYKKLKSRINHYSDSKTVMKLIVILLLIINAAGLFAIATTGAGTGRTVVAEYIHRNYNESKINIIQVGDLNIYMDWGPPKNSYYSSSGFNVVYIGSVWQDGFLNIKKAGVKNLLVIYKNDITGPRFLEFARKIGLVKVYENIPAPTAAIYNIFNPTLNDLAITVYEFK